LLMCWCANEQIKKAPSVKIEMNKKSRQSRDFLF